MKKILFCVILFFAIITPAYAGNSTFLIINQVRGEEICCQRGSTDMIKAINKSSDLKDLPQSFALRFDALDDKYIPLFPKKDNLGILLEVTPLLAKASGVSYKGSKEGSDWYSAKNAFLIGYTKKERKKLIDTAFTRFFEKFGFYPKFTVSWMIDAWSLNYIRKTYQVKLHEITKEQYETDSYTLYGGIFNLPYYSSKDHPLLPGFGEEKLDLIIVRQTVSDILKNYGSPKSYFTSQPNDYLSNPKIEKNYFENLINDVLSQEKSFGLIGFENSFSWKTYGPEFFRQLEFLENLNKKNQIQILSIPQFIVSFNSQNPQNSPATLENENIIWHFGQSYRVRLIKKNDSWILDDLRIFGNIKDPYKENPARLDFAYWIVPYIFDNSQNPFGLYLGRNIKNKVHFDKTSITISKDIDPSFTNGFSFADLLREGKKKTLSFPKHPKFFINPKSKDIEIGWEINGKEIPFLRILNRKDFFELIPKIENPSSLKDLDFFLQPDRSDLPIDSQKTIVYWNNTLAVAGRNPVRVFILPQNKFGRPSSVHNLKVKESTKKVNIVYPKDYSYKISPWFIDITAKEKVDTKVDIVLDGKVLGRNIRLSFAPDCQIDIKNCLRHPSNFFSYIIALLDEKWRFLIDSLKTRR